MQNKASYDAPMKTVTLRNVPRPIAEIIERTAARERLSLNRTVIRLLERATGSAVDEAGPVGEHDDLDHLIGAWSSSQAEAFEEKLQAQRQLDDELWR